MVQNVKKKGNMTVVAGGVANRMLKEFEDSMRILHGLQHDEGLRLSHVMDEYLKKLP